MFSLNYRCIEGRISLSDEKFEIDIYTSYCCQQELPLFKNFSKHSSWAIFSQHRFESRHGTRSKGPVCDSQHQGPTLHGDERRYGCYGQNERFVFGRRHQAHLDNGAGQSRAHSERQPVDQRATRGYRSNRCRAPRKLAN
ncbi:hypothetical protein AYI70_g9625, partial [Smittium culicis]